MANKRVDLSGRRFGKLIAIRDVGTIGKGRAWFCNCDCGGTKIVRAAKLTDGGTKSCGCLPFEHNLKHGLAKRQFKRGPGYTRSYIIWMAMRRRCLMKTDPAYPNYGGRGITICKRWDDYANFLADMGEPPTPKHSIDRINNDKGYSPSNCRWATQWTQSINRRGKTNGTSQYKGVIWHKQSQKWRARIRKDNVLYSLGMFHNEKEAALAYNKAAIRLFGKDAYLNSV